MSFKSYKCIVSSIVLYHHTNDKIEFDTNIIDNRRLYSVREKMQEVNKDNYC